MSKHTPTPWVMKCVPTQAGVMYVVMSPKLIDHKHGGICLYDDRTSLNPHPEGEQEANAAFIVRACNSHEELVKMLEAAIPYLDVRLGTLRDDCLKALKLAKS